MKNKAFTLTELLVVVVIIGTLSAVVLPKFTKVIETRRTGEAEEIMAAVRSEQEARCTLDKTYTAQAKNLHSLEGVEGNQFAYGKNYQFTLNDTGMTAARKGKDYQLKMKSYADGGLCCEGNYCEKLNKSYPACSEYNPTVLSGCAVPELAEGEGSQVFPRPQDHFCTINQDHLQGELDHREDCACGSFKFFRWVCNEAEKRWELYEDASSCKAEPTGEKTACANKNGVWNSSSCTCTCSASEKTACINRGGTYDDANCKCNEKQDPCPENPVVEKKVACDCGTYKTVVSTCKDGKWTDTTSWGNCRDAEHEREDCEHEYGEWDSATCECSTSHEYCEQKLGDNYLYEKQRCEQPQDEDAYPGVWSDTLCKCVCPDGMEYTESGCVPIKCPNSTAQQNQCAKEKGRWDNEKCKCVCPNGQCEKCEWVTTYDVRDQLVTGPACNVGEGGTYITGPCTFANMGQGFSNWTIYWTDAGACRRDDTKGYCACE